MQMQSPKKDKIDIHIVSVIHDFKTDETNPLLLYAKCLPTFNSIFLPRLWGQINSKPKSNVEGKTNIQLVQRHIYLTKQGKNKSTKCFFKSRNYIHKEKHGPYVKVSAIQVSSVTLTLYCDLLNL